jgi:Spy/CpxP family protein refolding chaperone
MKATLASLTLVIAFCGLAIAQDAPAPPEAPSTQMAPRIMTVPSGDREPGMGHRGPGKWWKDSELMRKIGVSDEQVQKIEKIFQDHRLNLIDLHAALEKQEAILEPLVEADQPDEAQVIAQIDKVAQARANLEKSNAQMLLAIRRVLTVDQWKKLRDLPGVASTLTGPQFGPPGPPEHRRIIIPHTEPGFGPPALPPPAPPSPAQPPPRE